MPFNAQTYRTNKARKTALAELDRAREIKRLIAAGEARDWQIPQVAFYARMARLEWRIYLSNKSLCR